VILYHQKIACKPTLCCDLAATSSADFGVLCLLLVIITFLHICTYVGTDAGAASASCSSSSSSSCVTSAVDTNASVSIKPGGQWQCEWSSWPLGSRCRSRGSFQSHHSQLVSLPRHQRRKRFVASCLPTASFVMPLLRLFIDLQNLCCLCLVG